MNRIIANNKWLTVIMAGLLFAILWASAATATKIGLKAAQPFVICIFRFLISGVVMLVISHLFLRNKLPEKQQWKQLTIYGLLNITIYLGLYVLAMQNVSAGLGALAVSSNPVFITIIAVIFLKQPVSFRMVLSLLLCTAGVILAAFPSMDNSTTTIGGIIVMFASMLSYSAGAVYFSARKWDGLNILTINAWQTIIGGLLLLPLTIAVYQPALNLYNSDFWWSVTWLAIPVSIIGVLCWLFLLKENPVKASYWLFLCPIAGFIIAKLMMQEPLNSFTVYGILLVLTGLFLVLKDKPAPKPE
ncbi:DMT family transporter [Chitinophaga defluvii]|uniref:EamA family transporter n=1 Tax=Chitinophaga defluvii TaxID=3163343 RepID=A0ABV2TBJ4_9BACT